MGRATPEATDIASPPRRVSAVDQLVAKIRELLTVRALTVGDSIPTERELGAMFGASRNTVREALVVLRAYGLIETRPKSGAVVSGGHAEAARRLYAVHTGVSRDDFQDVQGFRRIVETGVGEHIIRQARTADLDRLAAVNDRILSAATVEDRAQEDYAFHEALIALAGNRTTLTAFRMLRPMIVEIMRVGKAARPVQADTHHAHQDIVSALRDRDRVAYAYLVSRHLAEGLQFLPGPESATHHDGD